MPRKKPSQSRSLNYVSDKIIRSELKPGEKIQEEKLAEELGVSRSPVRESLRILEKARLVEVVPRHGARVTEMTATFVEYLFDILGELYALGARRFAERSTEDDTKETPRRTGATRPGRRRGRRPRLLRGLRRVFPRRPAGVQEPLARRNAPRGTRCEHAPGRIRGRVDSGREPEEERRLLQRGSPSTPLKSATARWLRRRYVHSSTMKRNMSYAT